MASKNPKGYATWNADEDSLLVVSQVQSILDAEREYLPLTVRQIFYRMVSRFDFEKTERAYKRLGEKIKLARRARMLDFDDIRDDGDPPVPGSGWTSPESFWRSVNSTAANFDLDAQLDQSQRVEIWTEAAGMMGMVWGFVDEFSVPVYSSGGFPSLTVIKETADRIVETRRRLGVPTVLLHVGDYDPSGESIYKSLAVDVGAFVGADSGVGEMWSTGRVDGWFHPERIALTEEQVVEYDLPSAPPKSTDSRTANWDGLAATQLEALLPADFEGIIRDAVAEHIDPSIMNATIRRGENDKRDILATLREVQQED